MLKHPDDPNQSNLLRGCNGFQQFYQARALAPRSLSEPPSDRLLYVFSRPKSGRIFCFFLFARIGSYRMAANERKGSEWTLLHFPRKSTKLIST